jgi:DNA-binding IclR family transcriptional regulator
LSTGARTSEDIGRAIGAPPERVRGLLAESERAGIVERVGADGWRLHPDLPASTAAGLRVLVEAKP